MDINIIADFYRWHGEKFSKKQHRKYKKIPQYKFTYVMRKCQYNRNRSKLKYYFYGYIFRKLKAKYTCDIPQQTEIGYGFKIEHIGAIAINPNVKIGNNVNIYSGVVMGIEKRGPRKGNPVIGNNVWVGANAAIVGNITVGNNVLIAPGAFVNFDVPNNSIVVGNPGAIKPCENAIEDYCKYPYVTEKE